MWQLADKTISSRLLLGTAQYPSLQVMQDAITAAACSVITVSLRRQTHPQQQENIFWQRIKALDCLLLPNTAGCFTANEAVMVAEMAREIFHTNWIKLEVIGDDYNLQPDPFELVQAAKILVQKGFEVFPYCTDDLVLCQRLLDSGCRILMPWAAPIGSGKGIINAYALETLRERLPNVTLIVDAGIGKPSHAVKALELGFDGVLLNTAVALAQDPVAMATAFRDAVIAGRNAYVAGAMPERNVAQPSTSLVDTPFWHQEKININKPIVWTIAGSDPSGAAGLQADLKTFNSLGVHGCSIVTAVTTQNRQACSTIGLVAATQVSGQITLLQQDLPAQVVKIGMLGSVETITALKQFLMTYTGRVVLDPVLIASSGKELYDTNNENYLTALKTLFPYIDILTPNIPETEKLLQRTLVTSEEIEMAAKDLLTLGMKSVLIKGGHIANTELCQDYWTNGTKSFWLTSKRLTQKCRGTGCTMASVIAACLAREYTLEDALVIAKMYVNQAIRLADDVLLTHAGWPEQQEDLPYLTLQPLLAEPQAFAPCITPMGLYPIVDSYEWLAQLLPLGVKTIQLRLKDKLIGAALEQEIQRAIILAQQHNAQLYINDHWELAIRYGAYGVHLGQVDLDKADVAKLLAANMRIGISTHCYYEVARAHALKPSYIACGPIFATTSKSMDYFAPQGLEKLKRWRRTLNYPLVAIGGIDLERIPAIVTTGVEGVALISAITKAPDPLVNALKLMEKIHQYKNNAY